LHGEKPTTSWATGSNKDLSGRLGGSGKKQAQMKGKGKEGWGVVFSKGPCLKGRFIAKAVLVVAVAGTPQGVERRGD